VASASGLAPSCCESSGESLRGRERGDAGRRHQERGEWRDDGDDPPALEGDLPRGQEGDRGGDDRSCPGRSSQRAADRTSDRSPQDRHQFSRPSALEASALTLGAVALLQCQPSPTGRTLEPARLGPRPGPRTRGRALITIPDPDGQPPASVVVAMVGQLPRCRESLHASRGGARPRPRPAGGDGGRTAVTVGPSVAPWAAKAGALSCLSPQIGRFAASCWQFLERAAQLLLPVPRRMASGGLLG
jgi:hypothetical protein